MISLPGLLKLAPYRFLLGSRAISSAILWIDFTLIFSSLSYVWHAAPTTIGIASALYGLPGLLLGPVFGRLTDRGNPVTLLMVSYSARGVTSLGLVFAPSIGLFLALIFLKGVSNLAVMPAEQVLIRRTLRAEQLAASAGCMTLVDQGAKILAPLLAALLATYAGGRAGFAVSALLSAVGIGCIGAMQRCYAAPASTVLPAVPRLSALFSLWRAAPAFRRALLALTVQSAVLGLYDPLLALFLNQRGAPAGTFGTIVSCTAGGAILGAMAFRRLAACATRLTGIGLAGFGLTVALPGALALAGLPTPVLLLCGCWVMNGACYALVAMSFSVTMQIACPRDAIGTVSSTARSLQLAALVLGPLLGSSVAHAAGLPLVFVASGVAALLVGSTLSLRRAADQQCRV